MIHENDVCPVCSRAFESGDDIVYCPECGTPHHRACWQTKGECANAHLHADGFAWKSAGTDVDPSGSGDTITCPRCGETCDAHTLVCPGCGHRFGRMPGGSDADSGRFDFNADYFLRDVDADPGLDLGGVTVREAAMFVQNRAAYYVRKFADEHDGRKFSWNWAAFFFSPFWFFYRKAYKAGAVFLGVLMVLGVFAAIPLGRVQDSTMETVRAYITIDDSSTYEQIVSDMSALTGEAQQNVQAALLRYAKGTILYWAVLCLPNFFAAALANRLYKKKVVRDVGSMRDFAMDEHTFRMLALRRGGVSAFGLIACYCIMSIFFRFVFFYA